MLLLLFDNQGDGMCGVTADVTFALLLMALIMYLISCSGVHL